MKPGAVAVGPTIGEHLDDPQSALKMGRTSEVAKDVVEVDSALEELPRGNRRVESISSRAAFISGAKAWAAAIKSADRVWVLAVTSR